MSEIETDPRDPETIWLSPACDRDGEGRTWASPAPERSCEHCDLPWVEYVRADVVARHRQLGIKQGREEAARALTDRQYMIDHLAQMLGPKGQQVWQMWQAKGVQRIHVSWGPKASLLSGEDIAQAHLDFEEAAKSAVPIDDVDGHIRALNEQGKG